jgi:hypothetical protein
MVEMSRIIVTKLDITPAKFVLIGHREMSTRIFFELRPSCLEYSVGLLDCGLPGTGHLGETLGGGHGLNSALDRI